MKKTFVLLITLLPILFINCLAFADLPDSSSVLEIRVQNLNMRLAPNSQIFSEVLLPGEIVDTDVSHVILAGPFSQSESLSGEHDNIFIFIKGKGILKAGEQIYDIESESIAIFASFSSITIQAAKGDTLHYVKIRKFLTQQDLEDIKVFPVENRNDIYFTRFNDCKAYTEKIKSPKTVSRTVLPKDHVPRVAMGTVETIGPDEVGAHKHPMLDQLFFGLAGNDVIVHANDKAVPFSEFALLHIPIGSLHWVTVDEGKRMYYQWMDFFLSKEGEVWLKTHKSIDGNTDE